MSAKRTAEVASMIRSAADRLTACQEADGGKDVAEIAEYLKGFADSLEDEAAATLVKTVSRIALSRPSSFLAGSVMAGLAIEQQAGETPGVNHGVNHGVDHGGDSGSAFLEQALALFRDSLEGKTQGEIADAGEHPLPLALAAVSIAWLLARPAGEEARGQSPEEDEKAATQAKTRPEASRDAAAVAPGGLGYLMTLSDSEEEEIDWGS